MKNKKFLAILAAIILVVGFLFVRNSSDEGKEFTDSLISALAGEGEELSSSDSAQAEPVADAEEYPATEAVEEAPAEETAEETLEEAPAEEAAVEDAAVNAEPESDEEPLDEDGVYDSKEEVALYLHLYHHLPSNYITKDEAKEQGWSGSGSDKLDKYCPGKCIGGDYFGNYENILPKGKYTECDIDTLGAKSRGVKRIVFSSDWYIYYTDDHYESFELLYEP